MKQFKKPFLKSTIFLAIFTLICGVIYTFLVTIFAQVLFNNKANGSIIEIEGKKYGSELLAQQFTDEKYMWGGIMNLDFETFKDENGNILLYSKPSNISPTSEEYDKIIKERISLIKNSNPEIQNVPIPIDLVTVSSSGLYPHISISAAQYQIKRIEKKIIFQNKKYKK